MNFIAPRDAVVTVSAEPMPAIPDLEPMWRDLERRADGSFFTSWTWMRSWLATYDTNGSLPDARLLIGRVGPMVVGLALIGTPVPRSIIHKRPVWALHQSGVPADDSIYVEYNDFLLDRAFAAPARDAMFTFVAAEKEQWRAVQLSGVTSVVRQAAARRGLVFRIHSDRLCPWVDLGKMPPGLSGYLAILSRNTRQQIQQSLRLYASEGTVEVSFARDAHAARTMLDELRTLHLAGWRERKGHEGAFGSPRFTRFVEHLVSAGIEAGSVQLMRASAGGAPIGLLLNFMHSGHVYAYQSGFAYRADNRFRPGLVTHALAIVRAREQGLRGYHFMAGEGRYKSSLANADEHLFWMTLHHDGLLARGANLLRGAKGRFEAVLRNIRR